MNDLFFLKNYPEPAWNEKEILRYAGVGNMTEELPPVLAECRREAKPILEYRVYAKEFPLAVSGDEIDLGFAVWRSSSLARNLSGCSRAVLFGATAGAGIDRLIAKYSAVSPVKALLLQAIGSERVEAVCDMFCAELAGMAKKCGWAVRPRFSPGYGDLPLEYQRSFFGATDLSRRLGVHLNESLLMFPSKSVTALVGLKAGEGACLPAGGILLSGEYNDTFRIR